MLGKRKLNQIDNDDWNNSEFKNWNCTKKELLKDRSSNILMNAI